VLELPGLEKAEGVADRIGIDTPTTRVDVEQRRAELQNSRVGLIEVGDVDVQVELLRVGVVWPLRRPEVLYALEPEHETGFRVQGREVIVDGPPGICPVDFPA
jgi:hypothetical protein